MQYHIRNLTFILIIVLLNLSLVMAHSVAIFNNKLEIKGNTIHFHNDGSIHQNLGEKYYENYTRENIIIKNGDNVCEFGEFKFNETAAAGFDAEVKCKGLLDNISVKDTVLSQGTMPVNKVYEVDINNEVKRFVGEKVLEFNVSQESNSYFTIFFTYFKLGVEHILTGYDHIFFILGFVIIAASFFSLVKSISGFTVSHSFTLTLAALGIFVLPPKIVEPMIALSILVVGLIGLFNIGDKYLSRFWLIFAFGLFHGLGFAGAIAEIGFPKVGFITSLIGFNLGVEAGQLTVVLIVYPFIYLVDKYGKKNSKIVRNLISVIVVIAGAIWLISRLMGYYF